MFEFNQLENVQLRKHSELHQIYYLDCDLIVMLVNFNTTYYFDVIQLQLKVSRKLIKIDCIPVFAFICGKSNIGFAHYDQKGTLIIESFDFLQMNKVKTNLQFMKTLPNFLSYYFKITQLCMLLLHNENGSIICYFFNSNLEIKSYFHLLDKSRNQHLQQIFQLNQHNYIISLYLENDLEILSEINSQGIQSNLKSKYLNGQNSLNGCAQSNKQIILAFTPKKDSNSFIEFIDQQNESVRIIEINYFNYIISIEQILNVNDLYVWCKISTQSEDEIEQICLFDINTFELVSRKIYPDYMLDIQCNESIMIETQMNLFDRINCLQNNHEILLNQEQDIQNQYEFNDFDEFSEITIFYNLNPIYQTIKIMKYLEFEEYIVELTARKLNQTSNNLKKQLFDFN
ncbi:unnamed protein product [Paramecium pentaurelia]|uniref:Uncharacterized protein n=1 Tax=Paramecium pentaurelia TaxID=43138 RepID=A0A8S1U257_9CILI|nr:unnamed protein product [Paramecium pentaurelia]